MKRPTTMTAGRAKKLVGKMPAASETEAHNVDAVGDDPEFQPGDEVLLDNFEDGTVDVSPEEEARLKRILARARGQGTKKTKQEATK